jgi:hypothetical protein
VEVPDVEVSANRSFGTWVLGIVVGAFASGATGLALLFMGPGRLLAPAGIVVGMFVAARILKANKASDWLVALAIGFLGEFIPAAVLFSMLPQ